MQLVYMLLRLCLSAAEAVLCFGKLFSPAARTQQERCPEDCFPR